GTSPTWLLKRARRNAAQAAYRKAMAQPTRPAMPPSNFSEDSDQWYITRAGARPKLTRSASESYWTPKALLVPVRRATRPSMPSAIAATNTAMAAAVNWLLAAAMMAEKPANRPQVVNRLGSR